MNLAAWIASALVALAFVTAGGLKLALPREALMAKGLAFLESFSPAQTKLLGTLEVLGAVGIIAPRVLDVFPKLVPVTAVACALLMAGAIATHVRRQEWNAMPTVVLLFVASVFVAVARFGPAG